MAEVAAGDLVIPSQKRVVEGTPRFASHGGEGRWEKDRPKEYVHFHQNFSEVGVCPSEGKKGQKIPIYSTAVILLPVLGSQELCLRHGAQLGTGSAQSLCSKEQAWRFLLQEISAAAP